MDVQAWKDRKALCFRLQAPATGEGGQWLGHLRRATRVEKARRQREGP